MIRQRDLQRYHLLREERRVLETRAGEIEKQEKILSNGFLEEFDGGEKQEPGLLQFRVEKGDRRPKWKEAAIAELGEEWAAEVVANTIPGRKIIVEAAEQAAKDEEEAA